VVELLAGLVHDSNVGRAARDGRVEDRTRSFAAYALGLLAHGSDQIAVRQSVATALRAVIDDARMADRDLLVAAIHGWARSATGAPWRRWLACCATKN